MPRHTSSLSSSHALSFTLRRKTLSRLLSASHIQHKRGFRAHGFCPSELVCKGQHKTAGGGGSDPSTSLRDSSAGGYDASLHRYHLPHPSPHTTRARLPPSRTRGQVNTTTPNSQHPTSNAQRPTGKHCWALKSPLFRCASVGRPRRPCAAGTGRSGRSAQSNRATARGKGATAAPRAMLPFEPFALAAELSAPAAQGRRGRRVRRRNPA
jgi:hypothetical protein